MLGGVFSQIVVTMDKNDEELLHILNCVSLKKNNSSFYCVLTSKLCRLSPRVLLSAFIQEQHCPTEM